MGMLQRAGTLPYIIDKDYKIIIIKSRKGDTHVLPKGKVEKNESLREAAIRETKEEAGVEGKVAEDYFFKQDDTYWFLMEVNDFYIEKEFRYRSIISLDSLDNVKDFSPKTVVVLSVGLKKLKKLNKE